MNKRRVANLLLSSVNAFSLLSGQAFAGTGTITTKDAGGTTRTFVITTDGSGNFLANSVICDLTTPAQCAAVSAGGAVSVADAALLSAVQAPLATQVPTISVGGMGIIDSAGTNVATVKAGTTAPVLADKTLVVGLHPSSSLPTGTNNIGTTTIAVNQGNAFTPLHVCGSYTSLSMSAVTSQLMILGSSGKTIYICDFDISNSSTSTTTLNFAIGTGTNCANGSSVLGQNWYLSASWGKAASNSYYRGLSSAALASASLCAKSSNTTTVDLGVYYDQY